MNNCEEAEPEIDKNEEGGNVEVCSAVDLLSDGGDDFCECQEQCVRPSSRELFSDEEFEDAEAEQQNRHMSGLKDLFYTPKSPQTGCDGPKEADGLWGSQEGINFFAEDNKKKNTSSHRLFEEWKNIDVINDVKDAFQAAKRFKAEGTRSSAGFGLLSLGLNNVCPTGKGDCRELPRNRSLSRIPVASGRCAIPQARVPTPELEDTPQENYTHVDVACNSPPLQKEDVIEASIQPETEISDENVRNIEKMECCFPVETEERSRETKAGEDLTNYGQTIDQEGLRILNELCAPSKAMLGLGPAQPEFVVMTVAEERSPKPQDLVSEPKRGRITSREGRKLPGSRNKETSRGNSPGLDTLIRDRSRYSLMKQDEGDESRAQRPIGRQSANSPGARLQAIREEKAQIRQRISSAKPLSPGRARKFVATPNIKQALTSPLASNSLKRDIASRRSTIERLSKEPVKRSTAQSSTEAKKDTGGSIRKEGQTSKGGNIASKGERTRLIDKVHNFGGLPSSVDGTKNKTDSKPMLSSLTSRYGARSRVKEESKSELNKKESEKPLPSLIHPRSSTAGNAEDDNEVMKLKNLQRPMSEQLSTTSHRHMHLSESSISVVGTNTEPVEDRSEVLLSQLQKEKGELHQTTEELAKELEFLKRNAMERDDREVELIKERNSLQKSLKEEEKRVKDLELKLADRENTLAQLRGNLAKLQDLSEKLKTKESQLISLRRQFAEESKEHNVHLKKTLDARETLQQELQKERDHHQRQINKMHEDNGSLQIRLDEASKKVALLEQKQAELEAKLQKEIQKNHNLEDNLMCRESELFSLEKKLEEMENSSSNILALSEQLMQKDSIISELEKHRASVQAHNTEMCGIVSTVLSLLGQDTDQKEVESLLTSGRATVITNMLRQLIQERNENKECAKGSENRVSQLEQQVSVLKAELEESKDYSETLAGVISETNPWNASDELKSKQNKDGVGGIGDFPVQLMKGRRPNCLLRSPTASLSLSNNGHQGYIRELFVLLEGKRQALLRMEKKMQELEEIHSNCAQKRVRNEIRIDQLETMLASYKE